MVRQSLWLAGIFIAWGGGAVPGEAKDEVAQKPAAKAPAAVKPAAAEPKPVPAAKLAAGASTAGLKDLQRRLSLAPQLTVEFRQTVFKARRQSSSQRHGRAAFAQPNRFRWTFEKPIPDEWIFDGKQLFNYEKEHNRVTRYAPGAAMARELQRIVEIVLNFDALMSSYDVVSRRDQEPLTHLVLRPKGSEQRREIEQVDLAIDTKQGQISVVKLAFPGGNTSEFAFRNHSPKPLKTTIFAPPAKAEVVDATL